MLKRLNLEFEHPYNFLLYDHHLSGGVSGELISWHLDRPGRKGGSEWSVISREHFKNLFSVSCSDNGNVYTVGQDRVMAVTRLETRAKVYSLPCFAGFIYTVVSNPIEPSTLAIGAGNFGFTPIMCINCQRLD